ncbi:MAG: UDP-2,3-diacylglucosamine diphosphatase LpxI [Pseudomonadota bacterium]
MDLAIIAGQGGLPPHLVRVLLAKGEVPLICEIEQFPSDLGNELPSLSFRLETCGTFLNELKSRGVTRLCMAGAVRRPDVDPSLIDAATMPLVPKVMAAMAKGDDGTLRILVDLIESQGIQVIGASDIDPDLLPDVGAFTDLEPYDGIAGDISAAQSALDKMAAKDLGQAVVARNGRVIAQETDKGTDAMLRDLQGGGEPSGDAFDLIGEALDDVADWLGGPVAEAARATEDNGGILYKAPKPGQELRVDMPVIGPGTVQGAVKAGLDGIVISSRGVMVLEQDKVRQLLQEHALFLWVHDGAAT